jgi:hypothetical protein
MIYSCPPATFDGGARSVDLVKKPARRVVMVNGMACLHNPGFAGPASVHSAPCGSPMLAGSGPSVVD